MWRNTRDGENDRHARDLRRQCVGKLNTGLQLDLSELLLIVGG